MLLPRLRPGDVAVLDVLDLDRPTARALADARVAAVVDASDLISGRFPNLGPEVLAEAGVMLVDGIGAYPADLRCPGDLVARPPLGESARGRSDRFPPNESERAVNA